MVGLNLPARTLTTRRGGIWSIAAVHERPGGDVDVILAFATVNAGKIAQNLYGYRYDHVENRWVQLVGGWDGADLEKAAREVAKTDRVQVFANQEELVPLLKLALLDLTLPDLTAPADFLEFDDEPQEWIGTREAAELAQVSTDKIRDWISKGLILGEKAGSWYEVSRSSVLEHVQMRGGQAPAGGGAG